MGGRENAHRLDDEHYSTNIQNRGDNAKIIEECLYYVQDIRY